jgi:hypothetical protein
MAFAGGGFYPSPMTRFQGRSAEKAFSKLCSDSGVTCNPSAEDDHGWDHIVEFPQQPAPGVSADMHRPIPAVFVQTKSHGGRGLKVTMKLSNALKLARSVSPAFVVLQAPDERGSPGWFAVHFWETLVGRALKRAREASRDGIAEDDFHKLSFSFTMSKRDRKSDAELLPWMASTVSQAGRDYSAAKAALHPAPQIVGVVNVGPLASIEQLVDHQLGLTPNIPISSVTLNLRRFGIDLPFPMPVPEGPAFHASMQSNPADKCDIWLRGPDGSVVSVEGDIIVPAIPNLPKSQQKIRIRAPMFDILWSLAGTVKFNAHIDSEARRSPAELEKVARVLSWSGQGPIDLRVTVRDEPLLFGTGELNQLEDQAFFAALAEQAGVLTRLAAHLKVTTPMISVDDVLNAENLFNLYRFIHGTETTLNITVAEGQAVNPIITLVASGAVAVGDWIFAVIQRFPVVRQELDGDDLTLAFGNPTILQAYAFRADDAATVGHIEADLQRYSRGAGVLSIANIISQFGPVDGTAPELPSPA